MKPRLDLRPDRARRRVWVTLDGQRLVSLQEGDREGLKALTTWLVDAQVVTVEEAALVQGVRPRTVVTYQATYAARGNSADLVARRHFNPGQQTAYRMNAYKGALIHCAALNLVRGQKNSERGLADQLGMDDRTVGRQLHQTGWRAAEEAGLPEEVTAYLDAERQRAYWAGVTGKPLASVLSDSSPREWQRPQPGRVGIALGVAHLAANGVYESLCRLVEKPSSVLRGWSPQRVWHTLLTYLMTSGGQRLSQVKHFSPGAPWKDCWGAAGVCRPPACAIGWWPRRGRQAKR
jgi:hypothetical protein